MADSDENKVTENDVDNKMEEETTTTETEDAATTTSDDTPAIIKMRGLPWSATVENILEFFGEETKIKNGKDGIHITLSREGRPSGEAYIELESKDQLENAMKKDKQHIGHRYIEIFESNREDMEWSITKSGTNAENVNDECCVRLRGLPFGCTKEDVTEFFKGLSIVPNGISFVSDQTGRNTGEAYVQFVNKEMVENALKKHLERIGHRYIEIFRSSLAEIRSQTGPKIRPLMSETVSRPSPYDRGDRFGGPNRFGRGPPLPPPPPSRMRDYPPISYLDDEDDDWEWAARRGPAGPPPPPPQRKLAARDPYGLPPPVRSRMSPPPPVRAAPPPRSRAMMYGNGGGSLGDDGYGWNDDEPYIVHMRGLPFRATEQDIMQFFRPLLPVKVEMLFERSGRPSGEANVEFETYDEAKKAMSKDKQNINDRYIELFLKASPPVSKGLGGSPLDVGRGYGKPQPPVGGRGLDPYDTYGSDRGEPPLFSRRGSAPSSAQMSNSAYDGFYGTSVYKSASSAVGKLGGGYMR